MKYSKAEPVTKVTITAPKMKQYSIRTTSIAATVQGYSKNKINGYK